MRVAMWGTRGSLATPGPETALYGGNTSCVSVESQGGTLLVLDAGTGIRRLGMTLRGRKRVDILLTHLHMDHIQGLGFFGPLYNPEAEVHIWGPASACSDLASRLRRYMSPPLFPVLLRDLPCSLHIHQVPCGPTDIGGLRVDAQLLCHPGPTVGYRIEGDGGVVAYMPDHEPALGAPRFPTGREWLSGYRVAEGADLLVHDAQYTAEEYPRHVGWGHSSLDQALAFAATCGVRHLVAFHHDPDRDDDEVAIALAHALARVRPPFRVTPAAEGDLFRVGDSVLAEGPDALAPGPS